MEVSEEDLEEVSATEVLEEDSVDLENETKKEERDQTISTVR